MAYLTFGRLNKVAGQPEKFVKAFSLNEILGSTQLGNRIFLSYRRKDVNQVKPFVKFLKSLGADIYIDYLDDTLPDPPDHSTASILRSSLTKCRKLIVLATPGSKESKWMPWELGLGDGHVGYENVLIFPLLENETYWVEQEYFKIYGYIQEASDSGYTKKEWAVFYPDRNPIWLIEWLKK